LSADSFLVDVLAAALASGLAIEASAYPKPGNVSPLGGAKGLAHWFFIATSTSMSIELSRLIGEVASRGGCPHGGIGMWIYRLFSRSSALHGGRNTHLGYTMLITPVAIAMGRGVGGLLDLDAGSVLEESTKAAAECSVEEDFKWVSRAILEASPSYVSKYSGGGPDIFRAEDSRAPFWGFVGAFRRHDIVLDEIWRGYPRVYEAYEILCEGYPAELYRAISRAFIVIGGKYVDTAIARGKGYRVAIAVMEELRRAASIMETGSQLWLDYAEILDKELRSSGINPGSIADIVATATSLCIAIETLAGKDLSVRSHSFGDPPAPQLY